MKDAEHLLRNVLASELTTTFLLSFVTASISFTLSETKLFLSTREHLKNFSALLGELFSCGYCLGHWIALILVFIYQPRLFQSWWLLDYFVSIVLIAWLAAFQWLVMCLLMKKSGK